MYCVSHSAAYLEALYIMGAYVNLLKHDTVLMQRFTHRVELFYLRRLQIILLLQGPSKQMRIKQRWAVSDTGVNVFYLGQLII